jgi:predicted dehydrogenase
VKEIKVGFIGCGGNARGHIQSVKNVEGARIVGVCDLVEDLARQAGEAAEQGAEVYTDHRALLDREDLDAVWISIPVFAHGEPEMDTLARGLPFLVEKPVARDLGTAKQIAAAVAEKGLLTAVGYQLRYLGATGAAKNFLADRTVGMVVGKYWSGSGRGDPSRWIRRMAQSGGQLVEQATHTIDLMRYLVGDVTEVYAKQATRVLHEIDCPDVNSVTFEFANGAIGSLSAVWHFDPGDWSNANILDLLYDMGLLHLSGDTVTITEKSQTSPLTDRPPSRNIDAVFVEAVRTGDGSPILSPYSDGVKSLAVSLAANESAQSGEPVKVAA